MEEGCLALASKPLIVVGVATISFMVQRPAFSEIDFEDNATEAGLCNR